MALYRIKHNEQLDAKKRGSSLLKKWKGFIPTMQIKGLYQSLCSCSLAEQLKILLTFLWHVTALRSCTLKQWYTTPYGVYSILS